MAHWSEDKNDPRWKIVDEICQDLCFVYDNDDLVQQFHETRDPVYWDQMIERYKKAGGFAGSSKKCLL